MAVIAFLFGAAVFALTFVFFQWQRVSNYWFNLNVTSEDPHPIAGNLTFWRKINPGVWMRRICSEFRFPYVGIWLFWKPALIVNSPDVASKILSTDSSVFKNRFLRCSNSDHIGKLNVFCAKEPEWGNLRRRLTVPFSEVKLRVMDDYLMSKVKELLERIKKEEGKQVDTKELYADFITDVIGTTTLGVPCNATLTGRDPVKDITKDFGDYSSLGGVAWCSMFVWPSVANIFRFKFFPESVTDYIRKTLKPEVAKRDASNEQDKGKDLLDALLKIKNNNEIKDPEYLENFIVAQAAIFLSVGINTSGNVLAYVTYELAHHPELQEKLYQELLEAKQKHGSDNFKSEMLSQLTYLNCVIKETLRKYPPISWLDRVAAANYKINEELTISAGTPVYINTIGMHYDKDYFTNPNKFDPDRFLPENEAKIEPYSYMPFGEGPRMCVGIRFAMTILRMAVASVFLNYKVEVVPGSPKPEDIEISPIKIFYVSNGPLTVKYICRT